MKLAGALILTALVAASATSAEALSVVSAEATLDWTGFTFTTTGTLSPIMIVYPLPPSGSTFTKTTPSNPGGMASADASSVNGFLSASTSALTTPGEGLPNVGQAGASASSVFFFYATGSGELVVTVPYQLELSIVETSDLDLTSSSASVLLSGARGSFDSDSIELTGAGTMTSVGSLTAAIPLGNATFGPLLSFHASADVRASAAVPEAPSLLLLGLGILALGLWQRRSAGSPRN